MSQTLQAIHRFPILNSTNDCALELAALGEVAPALILAEAQSAGRGRHSRNWDSDAGQGLYASYLLRPNLSPPASVGLTIVAGLALQRVLKTFGVEDSLLKWPNDIWLRGKKIAGILTETRCCGSKLECAVVGIGLNLFQEKFFGELQDKAGSVEALTGLRLDREKLVERLSEELLDAVLRLEKEGPDSFLETWRRESGMPGRRLRLEDGREGQSLDLNKSAQLEVAWDDGTKSFLTHETIFLR